MSHIALYREWRPQTFSDLVAQKQVTYPLKQSIINGEIGHAYLFSGTRGTGKTSTAKIFAKAVNCLHPKDGDPCNECEICQGIQDGSIMDVIEIDAASNNSVDNIRRITDEIVFMPTRAKYRVYIIDEVHMLSAGAFNALLKTLEEPPSHAIFILATTEPHRIPATVISRCLRFDFRRIGQADIFDNLKKISEADQIGIEDDALSLIAQLSDGAMRDAISLLDQAKSGLSAPITKAKLFDLVGIVQDEFLMRLTSCLLTSDLAGVLDLVEDMVMSGKDLERFIAEFAQFLRNILVSKIKQNMDEWYGLDEAGLKEVYRLSQTMSEFLLLDWIKEISQLSANLRYAGDIRLAIEVSLIKLIRQRQASGHLEIPVGSLGDTRSGQAQTKLPEKESKASLTQPTPTSDGGGAQLETIPIPLRQEDQAATAVQVQAEPGPTAQPSEPVDKKPEEISAEDQPQPNQSEASESNKWPEVLDYLSSKRRIDLRMLLSPAVISHQGKEWQIGYTDKLKSHFKAVNEPESKQLIRDGLRKVYGNNSLEVDVRLINDDSDKINKINPEEPAWIQKVRKMASDLDLNISIEEE